jgi:hypothetical protein
MILPENRQFIIMALNFDKKQALHGKVENPGPVQ